MITLKDYEELEDKLQDDATTAQHLVICTMMVDTSLQKKHSD